MALARLSVMACSVIPSVRPEAANTAHGVLHTLLSRCLLDGPDPFTPTVVGHRQISSAPGSGGRYGGNDVRPRFAITDTQVLLSVRK